MKRGGVGEMLFMGEKRSIIQAAECEEEFAQAWCKEALRWWRRVQIVCKRWQRTAT